jgi:hypothetical protein
MAMAMNRPISACLVDLTSPFSVTQVAMQSDRAPSGGNRLAMLQHGANRGPGRRREREHSVTPRLSSPGGNDLRLR